MLAMLHRRVKACMQEPDYIALPDGQKQSYLKQMVMILVEQLHREEAARHELSLIGIEREKQKQQQRLMHHHQTEGGMGPQGQPKTSTPVISSIPAMGQVQTLASISSSSSARAPQSAHPSVMLGKAQTQGLSTHASDNTASQSSSPPSIVHRSDLSLLPSTEAATKGLLLLRVLPVEDKLKP